MNMHLGKLLFASNSVVLAAMVANVVGGAFGLDDTLLFVAQLGLLVAAFMIFYFVFKTYRVFPEEADIFVGLSGFTIIFAAYAIFWGLIVTNISSLKLEFGINVLITAGYLMVTVSSGWLKGVAPALVKRVKLATVGIVIAVSAATAALLAWMEATNLQIFGYYIAFSGALATIFIATSVILFRKYVKRRMRLHLWAANAFVFLFAQEIITAYWLFEYITVGIPLALHPWQLQSLCIFLAFNLLGLAMTGKIKD
jgi:hypothetical protein